MGGGKAAALKKYATIFEENKKNPKA